MIGCQLFKIDNTIFKNYNGLKSSFECEISFSMIIEKIIAINFVSFQAYNHA